MDENKIVMDEWLYKKVTEILANFDFDRVQVVMEKLNWCWGEEGVPEKHELIRLASSHLLEAYKLKTQISSGGFVANYDPNEKVLTLAFVVESFEAYDEN